MRHRRGDPVCSAKHPPSDAPPLFEGPVNSPYRCQTLPRCQSGHCRWGRPCVGDDPAVRTLDCRDGSHPEFRLARSRGSRARAGGRRLAAFAVGPVAVPAALPRPHRAGAAVPGAGAAATTLVLPLALKSLIDQGLIAADPGAARDGAARAFRRAVRRRRRARPVLGGALLHGHLDRRARHRRPAQRGLRARAARRAPSSSRPRRPARCCRA